MTNPTQSPTLPEPIDAAGLREKVQVLIGALSAEVVRLREENERLRGQVMSAVDGAQPLWSGELADLKAAAAGMAAALEAIEGESVFNQMRYAEDTDTDYFLRCFKAVKERARSAITLYRAATSGAG